MDRHTPAAPEHWKPLLDALPQCVFILDQNRRVAAVNQAMAARLGQDPARVLGLPCQDALQCEEGGPDRCPVCNGGDHVPTELFLRALHGWFEIAASPLNDPEGRPVGTLHVAHDISRRKGLEQAMVLAERNYRSIYENALEGIYQSTLEGRFIRANPALARMAGYDSPQELIVGVTDIAAQLYDDPAQRDEFLETMQRHGSVEHFEVRMRRKDGTPIWVSISARAVPDGEGGVAYRARPGR
jgi:PAS domain S-box-containing protein